MAHGGAQWCTMARDCLIKARLARDSANLNGVRVSRIAVAISIMKINYSMKQKDSIFVDVS